MSTRGALLRGAGFSQVPAYRVPAAGIRHTWASWHRQSGTPTHELQRLGGWRSSVMVERYAHLAPDHLAKAANRIDSLLGGYDLATPEKVRAPAKQLTH